MKFDDLVIPPIEASLAVPLPTPACPFPAVERRYYDRYFSGGDDKGCVMMHSNRICLVTISPEHPVIRENKKIQRVNFQVSENLSRLTNVVRGKGKKGGQPVDEGSVLAWIECEGGEKFAVRSHVKGKLVEINERLTTCPSLLAEKPLSDGYVAIVLPKLPDGLEDVKRRLTKEKEEAGVGGTDAVAVALDIA